MLAPNEYKNRHDRVGQYLHWKICRHYNTPHAEGEVEDEVAFFSAKRWDRRYTADPIESATPCHDAHVVGF